ncbi:MULTISPECIES: M20/M25/M40 family metallo-hydrolase [unclassified Adlercreutzia]|uniref:M20/M25/M40 family metallo-hydrolase n=1 Tax=unclassified Adlercreutzia TaxID=2636013 RepID=UPI0013EDE34A|nr:MULTISPECIES: M20/M25/M40 family metallo-hydrolase [unclassified Adlercreutzia]
MNPQRLLDSFLAMTAVESPSWHEAAMADFCARELEGMGFAVAFDDSGEETGSEVGNLIAHLRGTVPGHIAFSAHMDTVVPCAGIRLVIERRPAAACGYEDAEGEVEVICSTGETILSADDKAGIAAIFEGVRATLEAGAPRPDLTVVLTTCEEQSLLGASALAPDVFARAAVLPDERTNVSRETFSNGAARAEAGEDERAVACAGADGEAGGSAEERASAGAASAGVEEHASVNVASAGAEERSSANAASASARTNVSRETLAEPDLVPCFVLDADGHPGSIIVGAPFHYTLRARFTGRAAHAGVEPEAGASAIQMAAHAVAGMPLGRIDEHTTANVGVVSGGAAVNIVPEICCVEGECRSLFEDRVNAQRDAMTRACEEAAARFGGTVEVDWTVDYPGILFSEDAPIVSSLVRAAKAAGLTPRLALSGGGADANVLSTKGACAITLGIGMTNFHTCDEHITVRDLEGSARYVEAVIAEYAC